MTEVALSNIGKFYGKHRVVDGVNLKIGSGEFCVLVGPSGCGKSTLLRMIAGLEPVSKGEIRIDGAVVNNVDAADRGIAMVFQSYALYPHMTVAQNMGFALRMAGVRRSEIDARVRRAGSILQIDEALFDRKPSDLSGGQRQRVAIGRAIVREPKVFLLDEPLSNLDASLRTQTRIELARLHKDLKSTMIYVTHDQVEAMTLADRIVVLRGGIIEQQGRPLDVYRRPANRFVAQFIGTPAMNFLPTRARRTGERIDLVLRSGEVMSTALPSTIADGEAIEIGVRSQDLTSVPNGPILVTPHLVEMLGSETIVYATTPDGASIAYHGHRAEDVELGTPLTLGFDPANLHYFRSDGTAIRPMNSDRPAEPAGDLHG